MKKLIIPLLLILFSCNNPVKTPVIISENVSIQQLKDSLAILNADYYIKLDSLEVLKDSIKNIKHSITPSEFDAKFRIARIKKYVAICDYNPVQKKYFFGWVKRAVR
jgi:hypothetical protein